jgi:EPS-associated MarR family transcriptional regulator
MNALVHVAGDGLPGATLRSIKQSMLDNETRYRVMRLLEAHPQMSQRDIARELGISLGKVNYCVRALVQKGWFKVSLFKNSKHKAAYMYLLTPRGIEQKARVTARFLQIKMREHAALSREIAQLRADAGRQARR